MIPGILIRLIIKKRQGTTRVTGAIDAAARHLQNIAGRLQAQRRTEFFGGRDHLSSSLRISGKLSSYETFLDTNDQFGAFQLRFEPLHLAQ